MGIVSYNSLEDAIEGCFGKGVKITDRSYVGGGDINDSFRLILDCDKRVFVKSNTLENRAFFEAEYSGLEAIASTKTLKTPKVLCMGIDESAGISFLMMEMIERGQSAKDCAQVFGQRLAKMHSADTSAFVRGGRFGFVSDNFIGATKQINTCKDSWIEFFAICRLEPQLKMAAHYFERDILQKLISALDRLDTILVEPDHPSLLHGDMWSGNIMTGSDGQAMLIDPAAYVGHAEADIAMTELFGRLPGDFYRSYAQSGLLAEGYEDRRDMYNLYHLLNHLNLFGRSYLSPVCATMRKYGFI
ncbi:MAG: fructosamine kinase family protein [Lachnospiraceae bacterium]|nr:fructosamine kinase family protein [Lachnospiraceae bacterium]